MFSERPNFLIALGIFWARALPNATKWGLMCYEFVVMIRHHQVSQVEGICDAPLIYEAMAPQLYSVGEWDCDTSATYSMDKLCLVKPPMYLSLMTCFEKRHRGGLFVTMR